MSDLGILVLSCDRYRGLWDLFFSRWERFWPDCPHKLYLLSNQIDYQRSGVNTIRIGEDVDWSSNLLNVLDKIPQSNLLVLLEDIPLNAMVDVDRFNNLYKRFQAEDLNYLNLKSSPPPNGVKDAEMGELLPGTLYRTALVPCLWKKNVLRTLTIRGETAWHFEILGSERSDEYKKFYSTRRQIFEFVHCVIRGKIDRRAAKKLQKAGELHTIDFPIMTRREQLSIYFRELRSIIFSIIVPHYFRRRMRSYYYNKVVGKGKII